LNAQFYAEIDGALVEGRGHRDKIVFSDRIAQYGKILVRQARIQRFLYVSDIRTVEKILVDKTVYIPELQLYGSADIVKTDYTAVIRDDLEASFHSAEMIVRQFKNKQIFENIPVHGSSLFSRTSFQSSMFSISSSRSRKGYMSSIGTDTIRPSGSCFELIRGSKA